MAVQSTSQGEAAPVPLLSLVGLAFFWQLLRGANVAALFDRAPAWEIATLNGWVFSFYVLTALVAVGVLAVGRTHHGGARSCAVACWSARGVRGAKGLLATGACASLVASGALVVAPAGLPGIVTWAAVLFLYVASLVALAASWAGSLSQGEPRGMGQGLACVFGSAFLSIVMAFVLFDLAGLHRAIIVIAPLCSAVALLFVNPGQRGDVASASKGARSAERLPHLMTVVLVCALVLATLGKGVCDSSLACWPGDVGYLKHVITISELAIVLLACLCARTTDQLVLAGWLVLLGGLATGLFLVALAGDGALIQVGLGTLSAARVSCEALVCAMAAARYGSGIPSWRLMLGCLIVPSALACLGGYAVLPTLLGRGPAPYDGSASFTCLVLGCVAVVLMLLVTALLSLRATGEDSPAGTRTGRVQTGEPAYTTSPYGSAAHSVESCAPTSATSVAAIDVMRGAVLSESVAGLLAERFGLTPKECTVSLLMARGYAIRRIAEIEVVSENTVKSHVRGAYRKLGVHTRQELIDVIEGLGLDGASGTTRADATEPSPSTPPEVPTAIRAAR